MIALGLKNLGFIPLDDFIVEDHGDGQVLAAWLSAQPQPSSQEIEDAALLGPIPTLDDYRRAIQSHVDATPQQRAYDSGVTCSSYVNSTNPTWAAEAAAFVAWRDAVWAYAYTELAKVEGGTRPQPSVADIVAELPAMVWPA
ncbi:MAG TPA: hypothetical protein VGO06_13640 [Bosea sp. (in: a-proteobacteria)]|jgi:hypothetical protein|uniref:hypothetical protein n=1 Tax=Bosea sp. (in: a-proteobacteria) TaxID=1871050 RepID=UPI002E12627B|nr:hypothetical protein [Bosea sp. (in: a-proteobacteria)]